MLHRARHIWLRAISCLVLLSSICCAERSPATAVLLPASKPSSASPGTCPSGSINYITHRLPQQCLKTGWSVSPTSTASDGNAATTTVAALDRPPTTVNVTETATFTAVNVTSAPSVESVIATASPIPTEPDVSVEATSTVSKEKSSTNTSTSTTIPEASTEAEVEADSPFDNAKFLSFEEWKKQNLEQAGQSAENVGHGRGPIDSGRDRSRPGINTGLDALGEDSEIELDFTGFGGSAIPVEGGTSGVGNDASRRGSVEAASSAPTARNKDAGRTCKERSNYASFDCAANVLKTNARCKSSSSILVENKDSYMLNECSVDNKFIIVELCDDILIDTIVLANFEFFSSMFRTFRVSVSDRYPVKLERWKDLGTFEARNSREIQAFLIENPLIWARYLRVELLTHYGTEYYCPVSLLRVHGTTMMDEFRHQEQLSRGEIDDEEESLPEEDERKVMGSASYDPTFTHNIVIASESPPISVQETRILVSSSMSSTSSSAIHSEIAIQEERNVISACAIETKAQPNNLQVPTTETSSGTSSSILPPSTETNLNATTASTSLDAPQIQSADTASIVSSLSEQSASSSTQSAYSSTVPDVATQEDTPIASVASTMSNTTVKSTSGSANPSPLPAGSSSATSSQPLASASPPATQESFFKSIHKRLQALEANASLSLQYIESQSQLLRDAFAKVEKRQLAKTSAFLDSLNTTVVSELGRFRSDYDELWQSTVLELAAQREEGRREREILGERIRMLAEEMVGQKRIIAAQATALLICAGLLLFTRFAGGGGQDIGGGHRKSKGSISINTTSPMVGGKRVTKRRWKWDGPLGSWAKSPVARTKDSIDGAASPMSEGEQLERRMTKLSVDGFESPTCPSSPGLEAEIALEEGDEMLHVDARTPGVKSAPTTPLIGTPVFLASDGGDDGDATADVEGGGEGFGLRSSHY